MTEALRAWPGGLVIASHDRALLAAIGVDTSIELRTLEAAPTSGGLSSARPPLFL
jgi:ATPase subunit of ABC transporter with duplicated ATPase domains